MIIFLNDLSLMKKVSLKYVIYVVNLWKWNLHITKLFMILMWIKAIIRHRMQLLRGNLSIMDIFSVFVFPSYQIYCIIIIFTKFKYLMFLVKYYMVVVVHSRDRICKCVTKNVIKLLLLNVNLFSFLMIFRSYIVANVLFLSLKLTFPI